MIPNLKGSEILLNAPCRYIITKTTCSDTLFFMPLPLNDHSFLRVSFLSQLSNSRGEKTTDAHDTSTSWDLFWQQHVSSRSHAVGTQHTAHIKLPKGTHSISHIPRKEASSLFTFREPAWDVTALGKGRGALCRAGKHRGEGAGAGHWRCRAAPAPRGHRAPARLRGKVGQGQASGQPREAWNPARLPPPAPGPLLPAAARGSPHRQRPESDTRVPGRRSSGAGPTSAAVTRRGGRGQGQGGGGRSHPAPRIPAGSQDGGGRSRSPARRRPPSPGGRAAPGTAARPREAAGNAAPRAGPAPRRNGTPRRCRPSPLRRAAFPPPHLWIWGRWADRAPGSARASPEPQRPPSRSLAPAGGGAGGRAEEAEEKAEEKEEGRRGPAVPPLPHGGRAVSRRGSAGAAGGARAEGGHCRCCCAPPSAAPRPPRPGSTALCAGTAAAARSPPAFLVRMR